MCILLHHYLITASHNYFISVNIFPANVCTRREINCAVENILWVIAHQSNPAGINVQKTIYLKLDRTTESFQGNYYG